jgi:ribosome recycling factor
MPDQAGKFDLKALEKRMEGAIATLKTEFGGLRTGRASAHLLDTIQVPAYGSTMPLTQVASVSVPEARMIAVNVWDRSMVGAVDRAIRESPIGLNPVMDGQTLRIPIPPLSEERRAELAKLAGRYAEAQRVAVRNVRRDGMDLLKKLEKAGELNQDAVKSRSDEVQKLTDRMIARIDEALKAKEEEIMQV